jgi:hypothetical protein
MQPKHMSEGSEFKNGLPFENLKQPSKAEERSARRKEKKTKQETTPPSPAEADIKVATTPVETQAFDSAEWDAASQEMANALGEIRDDGQKVDLLWNVFNSKDQQQSVGTKVLAANLLLKYYRSLPQNSQDKLKAETDKLSQFVANYNQLLAESPRAKEDKRKREYAAAEAQMDRRIAASEAMAERRQKDQPLDEEHGEFETRIQNRQEWNMMGLGQNLGNKKESEVPIEPIASVEKQGPEEQRRVKDKIYEIRQTLKKIERDLNKNSTTLFDTEFQNCVDRIAELKSSTKDEGLLSEINSLEQEVTSKSTFGLTYRAEAIHRQGSTPEERGLANITEIVKNKFERVMAASPQDPKINELIGDFQIMASPDHIREKYSGLPNTEATATEFERMNTEVRKKMGWEGEVSTAPIVQTVENEPKPAESEVTPKKDDSKTESMAQRGPAPTPEALQAIAELKEREVPTEPIMPATETPAPAGAETEIGEEIRLRTEIGTKWSGQIRAALEQKGWALDRIENFINNNLSSAVEEIYKIYKTPSAEASSNSEVTIAPEAAEAETVRLSIENIKDIILSRLEGKAKINSFDMQSSGEDATFQLDATTDFGNLKISGKIVNRGNDLGFEKDPSINANMLIRMKIKSQINQAPALVKKNLSDKYGKQITSLNIKNRELEIKFKQ